jgi:F-type H+-transporting ATPase subunit b
MSSQQHKSSGAPAVVLIVLGLILMVVGTMVAVRTGNLEPLEKQGIPLNPGETIATIGVLLFLFPVVKSFFITPLQNAIAERNTNLEQTFAEAEQLRNEMTQMRSEYEQRLASTEAQAREQIQAQIQEAQSLRQTLMNEATQRADELVRKAEVEIEQEKQRAILDIRLQVVDLTLQATERVLHENMDTERNRRLIQEFIDRVEVAR